MSAIVPFAFEDQLVRTVLVEGEPWFVASDITRILGFRDNANATRTLKDCEKGTHKVSTPGGVQDTTVVSEPGLYRLIFRSNKPEAERFQDFVFHEVLPTLRRTGRYEMPGTAAPEPLPDESIAGLNVKIAMLRETRLIFGPRAARELWFRLGLPAMPEALRPSADADAEREGRACLAHLLTRPTGLENDGGGETWGDVVASALDGSASARVALGEIGLRIEGDGVWIANRGTALSAIFEGTRWEGDWKRAWRGLSGATPGTKVYKVDRVTTQGWTIPTEAARAIAA